MTMIYWHLDTIPSESTMRTEQSAGGLPDDRGRIRAMVREVAKAGLVCADRTKDLHPARFFGSFSSKEMNIEIAMDIQDEILRCAQHDKAYWHLDTIPSESLDVTKGTDYPPLAAKDNVLQRPLPGGEDRSRYTLRAN